MSGTERDECVVPGGHCFEREDIELTTLPPQYPEKCKHCGETRVAVPQEPYAYRYGPLTDEEAAELEQRLREQLAKPHEYKVLPPSPPYTPKAGEVITVSGTECTVNHVVHTADKLEIAATRLRATLAQPAGSAVLIDIPARDGAE